MKQQELQQCGETKVIVEQDKYNNNYVLNKVCLWDNLLGCVTDATVVEQAPLIADRKKKKASRHCSQDIVALNDWSHFNFSAKQFLESLTMPLLLTKLAGAMRRGYWKVIAHAQFTYDQFWREFENANEHAGVCQRPCCDLIGCSVCVLAPAGN